MAKLPKSLQRKLAKRQSENAFRALKSKSGLIDFSSNDYLGFSRENEISEKAGGLMARTKGEGNGATGSRLLSGNHELYTILENYLSEYHNSEAALVFNSGYDANLGFFSTVPQRGDLILYDELCHASIRQGIQLSHAKSYKFQHNSVDDFLANLKSLKADVKFKKSEIYVVTESVFSMDGDTPDLSALASYCKEAGIYLVVDEAHALGVFGKGLVQELGLQEEVFARILTFGKSLGVHGAAILGSKDLKDFLVNFCKSLIYTTGLPPHTVSTILAAYHFMSGENGLKRMEALKANISYFTQVVLEKGLRPHFIKNDSAIQICRIKGNARVKNLSMDLEHSGFDVRPILSPTVPKGDERLRFCIHSFNTDKEMEGVLEIIKSTLG